MILIQLTTGWAVLLGTALSGPGQVPDSESLAGVLALRKAAVLGLQGPLTKPEWGTSPSSSASINSKHATHNLTPSFLQNSNLI